MTLWSAYEAFGRILGESLGGRSGERDLQQVLYGKIEGDFALQNRRIYGKIGSESPEIPGQNQGDRYSDFK